MLRTRLSDQLKLAMKAKDATATSTLRLILAALKDRDIAARGKGSDGEISDDDILQLLQSMIKQRRDSIEAYTKGARQDLADREAAEIIVIEGFLPEQMGEEEVAAAVAEIIAEAGADSLKQMGQVMALLRERFAGRMDFGKASQLVKDRLG
ncbi:MAG: GatB/YqeY domain-containing protein [Rhodospirillales bacterium]|nr:GatB/YqeY domain-containing protein [Rhodospirillales bacterium]